MILISSFTFPIRMIRLFPTFVIGLHAPTLRMIMTRLGPLPKLAISKLVWDIGWNWNIFPLFMVTVSDILFYHVTFIAVTQKRKKDRLRRQTKIRSFSHLNNRIFPTCIGSSIVERHTGLEPVTTAWEAGMLPLHQCRKLLGEYSQNKKRCQNIKADSHFGVDSADSLMPL